MEKSKEKREKNKKYSIPGSSFQFMTSKDIYHKKMGYGNKEISKNAFIKFITTIIDAVVIWMASFLLLMDDKG